MYHAENFSCKDFFVVIDKIYKMLAWTLVFTRFTFMKIMIVLNRIARGGGENVAVQLANQFSRMGHEIFFVSNKGRNDISDFYPIEENVQILPCFRHYFPFKIFSLRRAIKKENPDIIIGVMPDSTFYTYIRAGHLVTRSGSYYSNTFEYDNQGNLTKFVLKNDNFTREIIYVRNHHGDITEYQRTDSDGTTEYHHYEYTYDNHGNWLTRTEGICITTRKITYYE